MKHLDQKKGFFAALIVCSIIISIAPPVRAATFINGSFESPGVITEVDLSASPGFVTGWTNSGAEYYEGAGNSHGWSAQDGTFGISFGHNGGIGGVLMQTFDTSIGANYTVSFFVTRIQGGVSAQSVTAQALNATTSANLGTTLTAIPVANAVWTAGNSLNFTATSTSTTLKFIDSTAAGGDSNWALDHVTVVPEPSCLLLLASASLLCFRRKMRL